MFISQCAVVSKAPASPLVYCLLFIVSSFSERVSSRSVTVLYCNPTIFCRPSGHSLILGVLPHYGRIGRIVRVFLCLATSPSSNLILAGFSARYSVSLSMITSITNHGSFGAVLCCDAAVVKFAPQLPSLFAFASVSVTVVSLASPQLPSLFASACFATKRSFSFSMIILFKNHGSLVAVSSFDAAVVTASPQLPSLFALASVIVTVSLAPQLSSVRHRLRDE